MAKFLIVEARFYDHLNDLLIAGAKAAVEYFRWIYANGDEQARQLDYVPLPESLVKQVKASWSNIKDASGKAVK